MFSSAIQGHLVQARVEELHRSARRSDRRSSGLPALVKRTFTRAFAASLPVGDEFAAIHGVQFVGHPAATRSRQS